MSQKFRPVSSLEFCMTLIEMFGSVHKSCQLRAATVIREPSLLLEWLNSNQLLVKFTSAIVNTLNRAHVGLVNSGMTPDIW
jgi:hypothetical protein